MERIPYGACPLCQATGIKPLRTGDCTRHPLYRPDIPPTMQWMTCEACGHVFTEGYWSPESLVEIFKETHANQQPGYDMEGQRYLSAKVVNRIQSETGKFGGRWLDVGFGNGSLLFTAMEYGFECVGLDLRPASVETLKQIGIEAHCQDIVEYAKDTALHGTFDVISMADVLEHTVYPNETLAAARSLLKEFGTLFVSCPAMGSPLWDFWDAHNLNPYWGEFEHYHNFGRKRLIEVLDSAGFDEVSYGVSERYRCCMEIIVRVRYGA